MSNMIKIPTGGRPARIRKSTNLTRRCCMLMYQAHYSEHIDFNCHKGYRSQLTADSRTERIVATENDVSSSEPPTNLVQSGDTSENRLPAVSPIKKTTAFRIAPPLEVEKQGSAESSACSTEDRLGVSSLTVSSSHGHDFAFGVHKASSVKRNKRGSGILLQVFSRKGQVEKTCGRRI